MFDSTRLLLEVINIDKSFKPDSIEGGPGEGTRHYKVPGLGHQVAVAHTDVTSDFLHWGKTSEINDKVAMHSIKWDAVYDKKRPAPSNVAKRKILIHGLKGAMDTVEHITKKNPAAIIHGDPASAKHSSIYKKMLLNKGHDFIDDGHDIYSWKSNTGHEHDIRRVLDVNNYGKNYRKDTPY